MTVIVYDRREGVMAGDSCWSREGTIVASQTKLWRNKDGLLMGCAGGDSDLPLKLLLANVSGDHELPTALEMKDHMGALDMCALIALPDRRLFYFDTEGPELYEIVNPPFAAIGSGKDAALAVMHIGAGGVTEACIAACAVEITCRPPITYERHRP